MKEKTSKEIVNDRFLEVISALKFHGWIKNDSDFAKKIGVNSSQISNIRTVEGKNVTVSIIENTLSAFPVVNSEYIFTGKGCTISEEIAEKSKGYGVSNWEKDRELQQLLAEKDRQLMEKDRFIMELLRRIDPIQVGKDEVTENPATVQRLKRQSPIQLPVQQKLEKVAV